MKQFATVREWGEQAQGVEGYGSRCGSPSQSKQNPATPAAGTWRGALGAAARSTSNAQEEA